MNNNSFSHFVWQHVLKYHCWLWLYVTLCLLWSLQAVASPFFLKLIIDKLVHNNHGFAWSTSLQQLVLFYIALEATRSLSARLLDACLGQLLPRVTSNITQNTVNTWLGNDNQTIDPALSQTVHQLSQGASTWINNGLKWLQYTLMTLAVLSTFLYIQPFLALLLFAWLSLFVTIMLFSVDTLHSTWLEWHWWQKAQDRWLNDRLKNNLNVCLFAKKTTEVKHYSEYCHKIADYECHGRWHLGKAKCLWDISSILLLTSLLIGLTIQYQDANLTVGDISFVLIMTLMLKNALWQVAEQTLKHTKILAICQESVFELEKQQQKSQHKYSTPLTISKGRLEMRETMLSDDHNRVILHIDKLIVPEKQSVAVVGYENSGKHKLCPLILRLENDAVGAITIDGQDINTLNTESLREQITYLQAQPQLMAGTLADNILYSQPDTNQEIMLQAAEMAHCHEWINQLEHSYDSDISAINLSDQQIHSLAMARALLKKSTIVLVEDSHPLGSEHDEMQRQEALLQLIKGRTTLLLTHHIDLLPRCQHIVVMHQGQIIQQGHHDELVRQSGHYSILWSRQSGGFLPSFA